MLTKTQELLEAIGKGMLRAAPDGSWSSIQLALTGAGGLLVSDLAVTRADGSVNRAVEIDDETEDSCDELRQAMYAEGTGTWYNAQLTVNASGRIESEFDYENPPLNGRADPELLEEDQLEFPRDREHLPFWHPSKTP